MQFGEYLFRHKPQNEESHLIIESMFFLNGHIYYGYYISSYKFMRFSKEVLIVGSGTLIEFIIAGQKMT